jgi:hypothetical protein
MFAELYELNLKRLRAQYFLQALLFLLYPNLNVGEEQVIGPVDLGGSGLALSYVQNLLRRATGRTLVDDASQLIAHRSLILTLTSWPEIT